MEKEIYIFPETYYMEVLPIKWKVIKETDKTITIESPYYKSNYKKDEIWKHLFYDKWQCDIAIANLLHSKIQNNMRENNRLKMNLQKLWISL